MSILVKFQIISPSPNSSSYTLDISFSILLEKANYCIAILQDIVYILGAIFHSWFFFFFLIWSGHDELPACWRKWGRLVNITQISQSILKRIKDSIPRFCFCTCHTIAGGKIFWIASSFPLNIISNPFFISA